MDRRGKRKKPDNPPSSLAKRLRRLPSATPKDEPADDPSAKRSPSALVMVSGFPADCTVLELKSRLEMYGPISRTRIDVDGSGYVTFRSDQSAEAAISASLDPMSGIAIRSYKVLVCRASDPLLLWRKGVGASAPSQLLPLSRHGRSNERLTAGTTSTKTVSDSTAYKGREIVAYDDLL